MLLLMVFTGGAEAFAPPKSSLALHVRGGGPPAAAVTVADYSGAVASLFDNMRAPAALIGGSLVPSG